MPLLPSKHLSEEESSHSDSSCAFVSKYQATKRNVTSPHHPEDDTCSVDTAQLVRSILHPATVKNTTSAVTKNVNDVEDEDSSQSSVENEKEPMPQQYPKSPNDSVSDANSIDTTELVRRIMHPRDALPSSSTSDRPEILCEKISSWSAPIPPSTIGITAKNGDDDFVLPDQSDSASSSGSSLLDEGNGNTLVDSGNAHFSSLSYHYPLSKPSTDVLTNRTRHSLGSSSPLGLAHHNSGRHGSTGHQRYQLSSHSPDHCGAIDSFQSDGLVDVEFLENSAFGFSSELNCGRDSYQGQREIIPQCHAVYVVDEDSIMKDNSSRSNGIVRQGLHSSVKEFSSNFLQSACKSPYSQSGGILDESIENFSDDEDNEAFGFGQAASTALDRWRHRSCDKTSRNVVLNGSNCHQGRTTKSFPINQHRIGARSQSSDLPSRVEVRLQESLYNQSSQPCCLPIQASGHSVPDTREEILVLDSTIAAQPLRRRRIRDPSSRPLPVLQPSFPTKPVSFPYSSTVSISRPVDDGTSNWESEDSRASTLLMAPRRVRNDVFGGSGVGVGSYQVTKQRVHVARNSSWAENERSANAVAVNNAFDEETSQPSRKRPNSKAKRTAANNQTQASFKRKKGYTYRGGKGGVGNWKTTKKRNGNSRDGSSRNGPSRTSALWAGNADDPELRHVGGAEMSF